MAAVAAMLAGVGMMVMCCSSSVAALMMGGEDDSSGGGGGGGGGGGAGPTAPAYTESCDDLRVEVFFRDMRVM
jgi:hypothetical protein